MKILFSIYFKYSDTILLQVFDLVKNAKLGFNVDTITIDEDYSYSDGINLLNLQNKDHFQSKGIIISDMLSKNSLMIFLKRELTLIQLSLKYESLERFLLNEKFIVDNLILGNSKDFVIAFADNYEFWLKEDESDLQTYELLYGAPPTNRIKLDSDGDEYLDVSANFGRTSYVDGIGLKVSWRMYFGSLFYEKFNLQQKLKEFTSCFNKEYLGHEILFIELFSLPSDANEGKNYQLLGKFRKYIQLDQFLVDKT